MALGGLTSSPREKSSQQHTSLRNSRMRIAWALLLALSPVDRFADS
jgi:hypothetical protein